jgi:integrase
MRGHIIKRGKNSYTIVLNTGKDPTTKKYKTQWFTIKGTKKEAEKRLSELLLQLDNGTMLRPSKTTLGEYLKNWLSDYAKPNLTPRSYERYESITRVHLIPGLGNIILTQLRPDHLQSIYTAKLNSGLSALTVRYLHTVLHKALQTAVKHGLTGRNIADAVDIPRTLRSDMKTWDEYEVNIFLDAAKGSPYYELFYLALFTGMRRGELLALRWQDIDFLFAQISVNRTLHRLQGGKYGDGSYIFTQPKTERSRRTIALSPSVILMVKSYKERRTALFNKLGRSVKDEDLVFCSAEGQPMRPNTITRAWANLATQAGVKVIRLHDARHTHASLLLKQGVHPKIVQERLGHASIQITLDTYSHVAPGLQEAAANQFDKLISHSYNNKAKEHETTNNSY